MIPDLNPALRALVSAVAAEPGRGCVVVKEQPPDGVIVATDDGRRWAITAYQLEA
jgi:hypothetical protein